MAEVEDLAIPGPYGSIPLRVYRPTTKSAAPVVVHLHGGGLTMGSNASFEPLARQIATATGATVIGVDYRLAPEWGAPVQIEESYAALVWVAANADRLRIDSDRLVMLGDSAGGGLAAGVALLARDRGGPALFAQVLMYPGLDRDMGAPSIVSMPDAPMLLHDDIVYMHVLKDTGAAGPHNCYRIAAYAEDLSGLPQAIVVTAQGDPIRDWGERYAARLRDARVQTTVTRYPGVLHGFLMRPENRRALCWRSRKSAACYAPSSPIPYRSADWSTASLDSDVPGPMKRLTRAGCSSALRDAEGLPQLGDPEVTAALVARRSA